MLSDKKGVVEMYREDPRAAKYRQMDKDKNGGHLPEDTVINTNICFCLVRPKYDQCADPIYTMLNANLKVWHVLLNPTLTLKQPTLLWGVATSAVWLPLWCGYLCGVATSAVWLPLRCGYLCGVATSAVS